MIKKRKALVIGATGLVGSHLVGQLLDSDDFRAVKIFVRRKTALEHRKLEEYVVDFDSIEEWENLLTGDVLFSTLGTTLRKAGSKEAQYKVDYSYQYEVAKTAAQNSVKSYALVSSAGAKPNAMTFYGRIKGELEEAVKALNFDKTVILKPSFLQGDRKESRLGEKIGIMLANILTRIPGFKKYRPIEASKVAAALMHADQKDTPGIHEYAWDQVHALADKGYDRASLPV